MSGGRGRERGGDRRGMKDGRGQGMKNSNRSKNNGPSLRRKKVLLLHGNRQTGEILLGRMDKFRKALLREFSLEILAPDAPHLYADGDADYDVGCSSSSSSIEDESTQWQRTWWHQRDNTYQGLAESMSMLDQLWNCNNNEIVAIMGFSQGSRLAHLISVTHAITNGIAFQSLKCIIYFSGYGDVPMPDNFCSILKDQWGDSLGKLDEYIDDIINIPSLHVMGDSDKLISLKSSEALLQKYVQPMVYVHPGNHFVPVKKVDIDRYLLFFNGVLEGGESTLSLATEDDGCNIHTIAAMSKNVQPDEEHAQIHVDEVAALAQIFPSEFRLLSKSTPKDSDDYDYFERAYEHPIKYSIILHPQDECLVKSEEDLWPPKLISLCIEYTADYPDTIPRTNLIHDMNYHEFNMQSSDALLNVVRKSMEEETGMPCVMGAVYAARDFFEGGGLASAKPSSTAIESGDKGNKMIDEAPEMVHSSSITSLLRPSSAERIKECNFEGLEVACSMLGRKKTEGPEDTVDDTNDVPSGKGGRWAYSVGLVGKPSAGKSTFFNAATAFARQRGESGGEICNRDSDDEDSGIILGGASMAPHPFTTIDPNIGYCLVPAPAGLCPEDDINAGAYLTKHDLVMGSTHGRDHNGRRFIPVTIKDVAGLVPGAYEGRGRGNAFLNDLTDADVLVHIVDASGTSDSEGNKLCDGDESTNDGLIHPLNDLEWVRNELVEWVYFNVSSKWESISRKGKTKLLGMFTGYKQPKSFIHDVFSAVEKYVREKEGRDIFDELEQWDEGDLHRLVSAFLGARFPMALALNKNDIPSSRSHIEDIESKLPIHGAHTAVGMSAHEEMKFIRHEIVKSSKDTSISTPKSSTGMMNGKVWDCLQAAISLREPCLVFPINDFKTYQPLPGMINYATRDSSLPNYGFISAYTAAGGDAPSQWNNERRIYTPDTKGSNKHALRDVICMKPGSTVEDVFLSLKNMRVLEGEFVRAEAASSLGVKPKPVPKSEILSKQTRILRIMTTKRREWQNK